VNHIVPTSMTPDVRCRIEYTISVLLTYSSKAKSCAEVQSVATPRCPSSPSFLLSSAELSSTCIRYTARYAPTVAVCYRYLVWSAEWQYQRRRRTEFRLDRRPLPEMGPCTGAAKIGLSSTRAQTIRARKNRLIV